MSNKNKLILKSTNEIHKILKNFTGHLTILPGPGRDDHGYECDYVNGEFHNDHGPAFLWGEERKTRNWGIKHYKHGKLHKIDGPAEEVYYKHEGMTRTKYCKDGLLHRVDGPSVTDGSGNQFFHYNGIYLGMHLLDPYYITKKNNKGSTSYPPPVEQSKKIIAKYYQKALENTKQQINKYKIGDLYLITSGKDDEKEIMTGMYLGYVEQNTGEEISCHLQFLVNNEKLPVSPLDISPIDERKPMFSIQPLKHKTCHQ